MATRDAVKHAAGVEQEPDHARSAALALMSRALGHLDSDPTIPAIVGAQLQTAIDALWISASSARLSLNLH